MTFCSRAVESTGVAAISGAPLRARQQVHAFTSRLSPRTGRARTLQVRADNALIINTKGKSDMKPRKLSQANLWVWRGYHVAGGGHAFIGLYLAKQLLSDGHSVTILNDGSKVKSSPL